MSGGGVVDERGLTKAMQFEPDVFYLGWDVNQGVLLEWGLDKPRPRK